MSHLHADLDRMTKLCEERRLALHRQREVNEGLVAVLVALGPYAHHDKECACRPTAQGNLATECDCGWRSVNRQVDAAIAAARAKP